MSARSLAGLALGGFAVQAVAFVATHLLVTGHDPMVNFVSEYALGPHVWLQRVGAAGLVGGTLALMGALKVTGWAPTRSAAFVLLALAVLALLVAQVFPVDPVAEAFAGDGPPDFTVSGWIHVLAGMVAAVALLLAIVILTLALRRLRVRSGPYVALASLCATGPLFYVLMLATPPATSPAGLYQRLFIVSVWLWQVIASVGLRSGSLSGPGPEGTVAGA